MQEETQEKTVDVWVGLDVGKDHFESAFVRTNATTALRDIPLRRFPSTKEGTVQLCTWIDEVKEETETVRLVMEATGKYSLELAAWVIAHHPSLHPAIVNPSRIYHFGKSLGVRNKTDEVDARIVALYGKERTPGAYEPPSAELAELRELSRQRDRLMTMIVAERLRAKETQPSRVVAHTQSSLIKQLECHILTIETAMNDLVTASSSLAKDVALLTSIPGVGRLTAMTVLAEMGDLRRFDRSRQASAFAGVSPRQHSSGTSVHRRTKLCKEGNKRVRTALYMAALTVIRTDNALSRYYIRLVEKGKPKMVALGAVMRKLLVLMRALLISEQYFINSVFEQHADCG